MVKAGDLVREAGELLLRPLGAPVLH